MNILVDEVFEIKNEKTLHVELNLCSILSSYASDSVVDLPFLRPHQHAPWHSFMVQLAAIALHRGARDSIPGDADEWRELLRGLTRKWPDDESWRLVVSDVCKPAFMQPPMPEGSADPHKTATDTPDDLDVL